MLENVDTYFANVQKELLPALEIMNSFVIEVILSMLIKIITIIYKVCRTIIITITTILLQQLITIYQVEIELIKIIYLLVLIGLMIQ